MADYESGFGADGVVKLGNNKELQLNDQDELWVRMRDGHCIEVFQQICTEI